MTETIKRLLEKHGCPVPFHEVRTRFLGSIATPHLTVSPLAIIKDLWRGDLPPFDSPTEANKLIEALMQGLWNDLTRHQKRSQPFRLTRLPTDPSIANLVQYSLVRVQEMDGFIHGLFGGEEVIDLPERAHEAIGHLGEIRAMVAAVGEVSSRDVHADQGEISKTFAQLNALTRIMETEIHEAILSCARALRQTPERLLALKPTVH
jgi:hypothetical protein